MKQQNCGGNDKQPQLSRFVLAALFLVFAVSVLCKSLFMKGHFSYYSPDTGTQFFPWYHFAATWIKQGIMPLWDPYQHGGYSFAREMQTGLFYPVNWLMFLISGDSILSVMRAIDVKLCLEYIFLQVFTYLFAVEIGLGVVAALGVSAIFSLSGFMSGKPFGQFCIFDSAIWLPFVLLFTVKAFNEQVSKRRLLFLMTAGVGLGLSVLAGHIQPPFHIAMVFLLLLGFLYYKKWTEAAVHASKADMFREFTVFAGIVFTVAILVGFIQLLPTTEYIRNSYRWVGMSGGPLTGAARIPYDHYSTNMTLAPHNLWGFIHPYFSNTPDTSPFLCILCLPLAACGLLLLGNLYVRWAAILGLLSLAVALGNFSIVNLWTYPLMDKVREPVRALFLSHFALAVLAGFGIEALKSASDGVASRWKLLNSSIIVAAALLLAGSFIWKQEATDLTVLLFGLLALLYVFSKLAQAGLLTAKTFQKAAYVLIAFEVLSCFSLMRFQHFEKGTPPYDPRNVFGENDFETVLKTKTADNPFVRVFSLDGAGVPANLGEVKRYYMVTGMGASMAKDYFDFICLGWHPPANNLNLLGIRYILSRKPLESVTPVFEKGGITVYENAAAMPMSWFQSKIVYAKTQKEAFDLVKIVNPADYLILEDAQAVNIDRPAQPVPGDSMSASTAALTAVKLEKMDPSGIRVNAKAERDGYVVISQHFYPGWKAYVDDEPAEIVRAYGILMAVPVSAGEHTLTLKYHPWWYPVGVMAWLAVLLAYIVIFMSLRKDANATAKQPESECVENK